jgi:hypothetical protein
MPRDSTLQEVDPAVSATALPDRSLRERHAKSMVVPDRSNAPDRRSIGRVAHRVDSGTSSVIEAATASGRQGQWGWRMKAPILIRLGQAALCGLAYTAEHVDSKLKRAFDQAGLPTPDKTRGQVCAASLRGYAARLERRLPGGRSR